jgi:hypothetical protein
MRTFGQGYVRGVLIKGTYYRIAMTPPDNWLIKWNDGTQEVTRDFGSKHDAQLFLQDRRN